MMKGYAIKVTLAKMEGGELGNGVSYSCFWEAMSLSYTNFFPLKRNFIRMRLRDILLII